MLSRRNVRIKVMQVLYSLSRDSQLTFENALKQYRDKIRESFELYLFNLLLLLRVAKSAREDLDRRRAKHLPSDEDRTFSAKLGDNECIQSLDQNERLKRLFERHHLLNRIDKDKIWSLYTEFSRTDTYREYLENKTTGREDHTEILLALYRHCLNQELFTDLIEDTFPLWNDDKSLIVGAMKKTIKALPAPEDFFVEYQPPRETTIEFGEELFTRVCRDDEELRQIIEPTLKNWDPERVAIIDMILLKMAVCELMHFPTIPTKVTLNEFVEVSKLYSTEKSKDFINGILDRLMKNLEKDGRIKKEGRGLID